MVVMLDDLMKKRVNQTLMSVNTVHLKKNNKTTKKQQHGESNKSTPVIEYFEYLTCTTNAKPHRYCGLQQVHTILYTYW